MSRQPSNMLRTRRRDNNVKPNRRDTRVTRLDRKSSRGMIYENEELRLRTININAEIERGQYDIKKLKRENELLKKEIWCLRDEYEKLDKLLKEKEINFSSSSTTCSTSDSESCSSCTEESDEVETSQNLENVQKTNMKNLHTDFDHLSVVPEENSTENSDKTSTSTSLPNDQWPNESNNVIKADQSYPVSYDKANTLPVLVPPKHFFSPIKTCKSYNDAIYPNQLYGATTDGSNNDVRTTHDDQNVNYTSQKVVNTNATSFYQNMVLVPKNHNQEVLPEMPTMGKTGTDLIAKTDNRHFNGFNGTTPSQSTFSNGGNLEELLNDIETISQDILKITNDQKGPVNPTSDVPTITNTTTAMPEKPYKSELNVVLMPNPMPLLGFDKYKDIQKSWESIKSKSAERLLGQSGDVTPQPCNGELTPNPFYFGDYFDSRYNPENFDKAAKPQTNLSAAAGSKTNLLELTSSEQVSSENEENLKFRTSKAEQKQESEESTKSPKLSIRRKVSIHFKGKKDKSTTKSPGEKRHSLLDFKFGAANTPEVKEQHQKTPSLESKKSTTDVEPKTPTSSDSKTGSDNKNKKIEEKKQRKSVSVSPDRKRSVHVKDESKKHKKHRKSAGSKTRRGTVISMDRAHRERSYSACTERSNALDHGGKNFYDDHSDRERTNSMSSCDTVKTNVRKLSNVSNIPLNGKVPWCACWGNGCI